MPSRPTLNRRQWLKFTAATLAGLVLVRRQPGEAPATVAEGPAAPGAKSRADSGRRYIHGFETDPAHY
jgi:hypothetical protein